MVTNPAVDYQVCPQKSSVRRLTSRLPCVVGTPRTTETQQRVNIRFSGCNSPFLPVAARKIAGGSRLFAQSVVRLFPAVGGARDCEVVGLE
jgi:hypothetical protein